MDAHRDKLQPRRWTMVNGPSLPGLTLSPDARGLPDAVPCESGVVSWVKMLTVGTRLGGELRVAFSKVKSAPGDCFRFRQPGRAGPDSQDVVVVVVVVIIVIVLVVAPAYCHCHLPLPTVHRVAGGKVGRSHEA
ncbi:hypothetical protein E4U42_008103 [Claviceps africana]|uniref:Uncharacterized protein n=1 Tax=Claviceps africana TaxID=83212 RepID=A0A8K0J257_9HYPO|nr:hypothetical protein E4U42_008103 [Claviceps africana]